MKNRVKLQTKEGGGDLKKEKKNGSVERRSGQIKTDLQHYNYMKEKEKIKNKIFFSHS